MTIILSVLCAILTLFLCVSVWLNIKTGILILKVGDALEDSLDILDQRYESMSKVLEKPVFFDSVEVRQVIDDIRISQNAILYVANIMVDPFEKDQPKEATGEIEN